MILAATSDGIRDVETGEVALAGCDVTHLVAAGDGVWALADHQDVLHAAAPGGGRPIARTEKPTARCVLPRGDGTLLVGTAGAHVLRWSGDGLRRLRSFDAVPGRDRWKNPAAPGAGRLVARLDRRVGARERPRRGRLAVGGRGRDVEGVARAPDRRPPG